jgi:hypothetical protein
MIKIIQEKIKRSHQRISDWNALRNTSQMGVGYIDLQLKWEHDRLSRLESDLGNLIAKL